MENIQQPIPTENILDSCSRIRIYFIEKLARNAGYKVYLFPNDATNDALSDYKTNFKHYVSNRDNPTILLLGKRIYNLEVERNGKTETVLVLTNTAIKVDTKYKFYFSSYEFTICEEIKED